MSIYIKSIFLITFMSVFLNAACLGVSTNDKIFFDKLSNSFSKFGIVLKEVPNNLNTLECSHILIFPLSQKKLTSFDTKTTLHATLYNTKEKTFYSITYQTTAKKNLVDLTDPTFSVQAYQKNILDGMAKTVKKFITKE